MSVHFVDSFEDSLAQLVQRGDADVAQEASRHLGERGLNEVEPRAMFGRVDVLEAAGPTGQVSHRLFGDVCAVVVEHHTDYSLAGIVLVEPAQQCSPLSTNAARPVCRAMPASARMCWSSKIAERSVYVKLLMERSTRLQETQPCAWERLSVLSRLR